MLLALLLVLPAAPLRAEAPSGPYSAAVALDATAASAVAARRKARLDGERRALGKVIADLTGSPAASVLSSLGDGDIAAMIVSYSVADERMSSTRYRALYTYHFDPKAVRGLIEGAGLSVAPQPVATAGGPARAPTVVLPVFRDGARLVLWSDPNAWREAWSRISLPSAPVPLRVPLGGIGDLAAIDAEEAIAGNRDALASIAGQDDAAAVIVALATAQPTKEGRPGLEVLLKRYVGGTLSGSLEARFEAKAGEGAGDFLKQVAEASLPPIENGMSAASPASAPPGTPSKTANAPSAAPGALPGTANGPPAAAAETASSLAAVVPLTGLRDWVALRRKLEALPAVRGVALLSLSRNEAQIEIRFLGTEAALRASLAGRGLALAGGDPLWRIEPADRFR